jgi:hypothetical protein
LAIGSDENPCYASQANDEKKGKPGIGVMIRTGSLLSSDLLIINGTVMTSTVIGNRRR